MIEVIGINEDNCINCHQCIAVCPVKVCSNGSGNVVKFNNQLCIGCGRCIEACIRSHGGTEENSARFPIDDSQEFIKALPDKDIIALVAPSAQCNYDLKKLITALRNLGISQVYDVSLGAEITVAAYHQALESGTVRTPLIAQPCPAIVKYIEINHPFLIDYLAPIGSPVHNVAVYVKSLHPASRLAFISPCLAKRREFEDSKMVDYNVTYQSLQKIFAENGIVVEDLEDGDFDNYVAAGIATNFSTPGGLKECFIYKYPDIPPSAIIRIEGPLVHNKYLADLENAIKNNQPDLPLIVDILNCEKGCNLGPGCINYHHSIDKIEKAVGTRTEQAIRDDQNNQALQDFLVKITSQYDFSYHHYRNLSLQNDMKIPDESELNKIYTDMHKMDEKDFRNCAACGYNSCYSMAVAIFNGLNKVENYHLYQEKELLIEQTTLNRMIEESVKLNKQLQDEIAERKQQEQLLVQNSKLAAMGEMIGMIAHQWRQPLSSISTLAGNLKVLIELDMYDNEQFNQLLDEINNHAQYLSNTINDFRHFFKPDNPQNIAFLTDIIEGTLGIIGKSLEYKNITLYKDYEHAFTSPILTYPNELMQVFLNIIKNATDVLVERNIENPCITIKGYEDEKFQTVEIIDNAGGIPENIMDKIFNPYFSTKGPATGTGLGLYMSRTIVEEHCDGEIRAQNVESGACFSIRLPIR
ncbi:MAG: [Fe-Fe] hydrogenase large subunit C-terminal domain-containing protein [Syntrophomonadaceae bacterium]|jgi:signal transduction histidine kinase/NAD-dependent dihydropyrimidine dehydrogenase PreA subunit